MKRLLVFLCILAASLSTLAANPYSGDVSLVVIDAGHGGGDPGAMANSLVEKDLTLSISLALEQELEKRGIDAMLTREDDTSSSRYTSIPLPVRPPPDSRSIPERRTGVSPCSPKPPATGLR